ncbi:MAG: MGMT family protein [Coriobacteriales bacterium]|nr:MGMT family protein [Coriobacteriales bacterium]
MGAFNDKVYEVVWQIPQGYVCTYGDIARAIGQPRKALFVGYAMHSSTAPGAVPCHRVVYKDGHFFGHDDEGNETAQLIMLRQDGVPLLDDDHVDLAACHWTPGTTDVEGRPTDIDWDAEMGDFR